MALTHLHRTTTCIFVSPSAALLWAGTAPVRLLTLVFLGLAARLDGSPLPVTDCCDAGRPLGIRFGGGMAMVAWDAVRGSPVVRVADGFLDIATLLAANGWIGGEVGREKQAKLI